MSSNPNASAQKFTTLFYDILDSSNTTERSVLGRYYTPSSAILWNGNVFSAAPDTANPPNPWIKFLQSELPRSRHTLQAIDAQVLQTSGQGNPTVIMVSVSGYVQYYGSDRKKSSSAQETRIFHQMFMLSEDPATPGTFYITSDVMRFV